MARCRGVAGSLTFLLLSTAGCYIPAMYGSDAQCIGCKEVAESLADAVLPDLPRCVAHAWVPDSRSLEEILPADQNAPRRLRVTRSDSTVIDLLRPFLRDDKIVGWDADDSRTDHRPFTLISTTNVLHVASWECVRWEEP